MSKLLSLQPAEPPTQDNIQSYADRCFNEAKELLQVIDTPAEQLDKTKWASVKSKRYVNGTVEGMTYVGLEGNGWTDSRSSFGRPWHCRRSMHDQVDYDVFRRYLAFDHPEHEAKYMGNIKRASKLTDFNSHTSVWRTVYTMPPPFHPRDFVQFLATREDKSGSSEGGFVVVQTPVLDVEVDKGAVRGKYISVERVRVVKASEPGQKDRVEWVMVTASDPGGNVPSWMADGAMTSTVCKDVPAFIDWAQKQID